MNIEQIATKATARYIENNGAADLYIGQSFSESFVFSGRNFGRDQISGFGSNDSILVDHKIFDANSDGIISFGPNGLLDINRVSKSNAGRDQIKFVGEVNDGLRYLGTRDGISAYASASTAINVSKADSINYPSGDHDYRYKVSEGTIGDDIFDKMFGVILFDTALGINTGIDKVERPAYNTIVTTTRITSEFVAEYTYDGYERMVISDGVLNLDGGGEVHGIVADGQNQYFSLSDIREYNGVQYFFYVMDDLFG